MSFRCGCGINYIESKYIRNNTCRICRENNKSMPKENYKTCTKCLKTKLRSDFYCNTFLKDGKQTACKDCHRTTARISARKQRLKHQSKAFQQISPLQVNY